MTTLEILCKEGIFFIIRAVYCNHNNERGGGRIVENAKNKKNNSINKKSGLKNDKNKVIEERLRVRNTKRQRKDNKSSSKYKYK